MNDNVIKAPTPWHLEGEGYILLYKFNKRDIEAFSFIENRLKNNFCGGLGAVMLVDYHKSNVGPYSELLFIPGKFKYEKLKKHHIPKIFVSSTASVVNGIENWAIPKEKARFNFIKNDKEQIVEVNKEDTTFFSITLKEKGICFPVNTAFLPFPLLQFKDHKAYLTRFSGKGMGKLVSVKNININNDFFPDISHKKPLIAIKVAPFKIKFPVPEIIDLP